MTKLEFNGSILLQNIKFNMVVQFFFHTQGSKEQRVPSQNPFELGENSDFWYLVQPLNWSWSHFSSVILQFKRHFETFVILRRFFFSNQGVAYQSLTSHYPQLQWQTLQRLSVRLSSICWVSKPSSQWVLHSIFSFLSSIIDLGAQEIMVND